MRRGSLPFASLRVGMTLSFVRSMKRFVPYLACVVGLILTTILLPFFNAAQPKGIRLTRGDAVPIADRAARQVGIPVDRSWTTLSWSDSPILNMQLETNDELRLSAHVET